MWAWVLLVALAVPVAPSALVWTPAVQQEYQQLLADARDERWSGAEPADQAGHAALRLATFSAALLTRLPRHGGDPIIAQRVRQLQAHIEQVNIGRVELDSLLKRAEPASDVELSAALKNYLSRQQSMATSFDVSSAEQLAWRWFALPTGDVRSQLEQMWSRTQSLLTTLSGYLRRRRPLAAADDAPRDQLILDCAASGDCDELVKMALPYPDAANALSDLLREKKLTAEQLAQLADSFLQRLGLPAAPAQLWQLSTFGARGQCQSHAAADRVQLCADADMSGLRAALDVMARSAYWRAAATQQPPFDTEPFPGFSGAAAGCVSLLALQPQMALQSVYGYGTDGAGGGAPVSLYLSGGARPAGAPDRRCGGDVACQMTANWQVETAVRQLLPLGYHVASIHWLSEAARSPAPLAAWRRHLRHTLGVAAAAAAAADPGRVDPHFYHLQRHVAEVLARYAGFQLLQAACAGDALCLTDGSARRVLTTVMEAGASQPWSELLRAASGVPAPTAAPLAAFFAPVQRLIAPIAEQKRLRTLELEDETPAAAAPRRRPAAAARPRTPTAAGPCQLIADDQKTTAEMVICDFNEQSDAMVVELSELEWDFAGNVSGGDAARLVSNMTSYANLMAVTSANLSSINMTDWVTDPTNANEMILFDEMAALVNSSADAVDNDKLSKLLTSQGEVYASYVNLMVCPYDDKDCDDNQKLSLWDLQQLMKNMSGLDKDALTYYWDQYRSAAKHDMESKVAEYVANANDFAKAANYDHYGLMWLEPYGLDDQELLVMLGDTWQPLDSVYKKLHAYVRFRLTSVYSDEVKSATSPLPSHLLGDIYAENWINIYNMTKLDDDVDIDITAALKDKKYSVIEMTHDANDFLIGMGLDDLSPASFPDLQANSDLTADACAAHRDCRPTAWNAGAGDDIRLRMVNTVDMATYEDVHSRMAALQYYVQYRGQDALNRQPANPAFSEAVAGAVALSALNPAHLHDIGLLDQFNATADYHNYLYRRALQHLAPLPFDFISQSWLWELYTGKIGSDNWNHRWWTLREDYQGVRPANRRSAANSDPLAIPSIGRAQPPFQRYFSTVLQFQLFEHFCIQAGQYDPADNDSMLATCDLTGHALTDLKDLMAAGRSQKWTELVEMYTETKNLSSAAMVHYFAPLVNRLDTIIAENDLKTEWESDLGDYWDDGADDTDNTVPIVVGVVLGVFVLIVLIAYFVVRMRRNREE